MKHFVSSCLQRTALSLLESHRAVSIWHRWTRSMFAVHINPDPELTGMSSAFSGTPAPSSSPSLLVGPNSLAVFHIKSNIYNKAFPNLLFPLFTFLKQTKRVPNAEMYRGVVHSDSPTPGSNRSRSASSQYDQNTLHGLHLQGSTGRGDLPPWLRRQLLPSLTPLSPVYFSTNFP